MLAAALVGDVKKARELNLRSKELLTVSRLRMVKENNEKGRALGRLNLTASGYYATGDTRRAVAVGLATSARTITSAALILVAVTLATVQITRKRKTTTSS